MSEAEGRLEVVRTVVTKLREMVADRDAEIERLRVAIKSERANLEHLRGVSRKRAFEVAAKWHDDQINPEIRGVVNATHRISAIAIRAIAKEVRCE